MTTSEGPRTFTLAHYGEGFACIAGPWGIEVTSASARTNVIEIPPGLGALRWPCHDEELTDPREVGDT